MGICCLALECWLLLTGICLVNQMSAMTAGTCLVQIVYSHRVKQFQDESGGDPSALLIPALLDTKVCSQTCLIASLDSKP